MWKGTTDSPLHGLGRPHFIIMETKEISEKEPLIKLKSKEDRLEKTLKRIGKYKSINLLRRRYSIIFPTTTRHVYLTDGELKNF